MIGKIVVVKVSPVLYTTHHTHTHAEMYTRHVMDAFDWLNEGFIDF